MAMEQTGSFLLFPLPSPANSLLLIPLIYVLVSRNLGKCRWGRALFLLGKSRRTSFPPRDPSVLSPCVRVVTILLIESRYLVTPRRLGRDGSGR